VSLGSLAIVTILLQVAPANGPSYHNRDYAFTLRYPKDFTLCAGGLAFCEVDSHSYIPVCDHEAVDCFVYSGRKYEGTNFGGAALSVNVLRDRRTEDDCNKIDLTVNPIRKRTINGFRFSYGMTGGVALGHLMRGLKYRTFYDGVCFELSANITETNFRNFDPGTIKEFRPAAIERDLNAMLNSIRFIGRVVDGPAWRVHHNTHVGGTFEYPDGDTVVNSLDSSAPRNLSSEITDFTYFAHGGLIYFVATKTDLGGEGGVDFWLKRNGLLDLSQGEERRRSKLYTQYQAGNYWYVYGQGCLYILGASDQQRNVVPTTDNVVFGHLLHSFKPD
jgi:hypothetical protein